MSLFKGLSIITRRVKGFAVNARKYSYNQNHACIPRIHDGKVALVTGSSDARNMGFAMAKSLARRGCSIILSGTREPVKVKSLEEDLRREYNVSVHYMQADFSTPTLVSKLNDDVKQMYPDGVDILVNNAGVITVKYIEDSSIESWERDIQVMLTAPFQLIKLMLPGMKKKGWGKIINTSSVLSSVGGPLYSIYTAAKHGLDGLTKVVALETLGTGVTCNAICPAAVNTPMFEAELVDIARETGVPLEELQKTAVKSFNPSGQYVEQEQVGELVAFLCSSAADQMTGCILPIDAGYLAR